MYNIIGNALLADSDSGRGCWLRWRCTRLIERSASACSNGSYSNTNQHEARASASYISQIAHKAIDRPPRGEATRMCCCEGMHLPDWNPTTDLQGRCNRHFCKG